MNGRLPDMLIGAVVIVWLSAEILALVSPARFRVDPALSTAGTGAILAAVAFRFNLYRKNGNA